MKFRTDWSSQTGHMHTANCSLCQDYVTGWPKQEKRLVTEDGRVEFAAWSIDAPTAFAVVADGCSTGGETDIGARVVARRLVKELSLYSSLDAQGDPVKTLMDAVGDVWTSATDACLELLGMKIEDALATCVSCYANSQGAAIHMHGDGVVVLERHDGSFQIIKTSWDKNTPFYPVYAATGGRSNGMLDSFTQIHAANALPFSVELVDTRDAQLSLKKNQPLSYGLAGHIVQLDQAMLAEIKAIALFSDGIAQVKDLKMEEAVRQCMAFKNKEGVFVKRHLRGAMRQWGKNHPPLDDLSYAVILPIEEKESDEQQP